MLSAATLGDRSGTCINNLMVGSVLCYVKVLGYTGPSYTGFS